MNKLEKLIEQGREVGSKIFLDTYSALAGDVELSITDKREYYTWLAKVKLFVDRNFDENKLITELHELSKKITPDTHLQMVAVLEALREEYEEKPDVSEVLQKLEQLENAYTHIKDNESGGMQFYAIQHFHEWYEYAIKVFYKAIGESDPDFQHFKSVDISGNSYVLSHVYDFIHASYVVLKEKLKNPPKSTKSIQFTLPKNTNMQYNDKTSIFISYSHQDKKYLEWLQKHLKAFQRQNRQIEVWDDTKIKAGDKWKKEIESALEKASVAFLLVSKDFLASDFVMDEEIPKLLQKCSEEGTLFIPIILTPCLFEDSPLGDFQAINTLDTPLSSMSETEVDQVFVNLLKQLKDIF